MISVKNLSKSFGSTIALQPVSFELEKGQTLSVVGLSGSGKSTLLKCLAGLIPDYDGKISISAIPHRDYLRDHRIAMIFQRYSNFEWLTVFENLAEAFAATGHNPAKLERCEEMLGFLGLKDWRQAYVSELSGGMAQRVALGRALLQEQDIIGLDEPFAALDIKNRRSMQELIRHVFHQQNRTAVFVTHDISEAISVGDKILVVKNDGRNPAELISGLSTGDGLQYAKNSPEFVKMLNEISEHLLH